MPFYCRNRGVLPGCSLGASFFYYYSSIALGNLHPGNTPHYLCQCPHSAIDSSTLQQLKYTKTHTISPTFQGNTEITPRGVTWLFPSVTWLTVYSVYRPQIFVCFSESPNFNITANSRSAPVDLGLNWRNKQQQLLVEIS